jgi:hypothetical protein
MRYEELFHPENVLFLANITDKSQKYCQDKGVELSVENIEKARVWLFKKQLEVAE